MKLTALAILVALLQVLASADSFAKGSGTQNSSSNSNSSSSNQSSSNQNSNTSSSSTGSSNATFESTMLAYGAVDQAMSEAANRICDYVKDAKNGAKNPQQIAIIDQAAVANIVAYDSFIKTASLLARAFGAHHKTVPPPDKSNPLVSPEVEFNSLLDLNVGALNSANFSAVFGTVAASTTDTASTIQIQDFSAELKLIRYLNIGACKDTIKILSGAAYLGTGKLHRVAHTLDQLSAAHTTAIGDPAKCVANSPCAGLDATYNQFLQSMWSANPTTGQTLISQVLQGYRVADALENAAKTGLYLVFVNVAAAGGTERVRKNVITLVFTGDWISYSGGAVINISAVDISSANEVKDIFSEVLRYRTPLVDDIKSPTRCEACGTTDAGNNWGHASPLVPK